MKWVTFQLADGRELQRTLPNGRFYREEGQNKKLPAKSGLFWTSSRSFGGTAVVHQADCFFASAGQVIPN